MTASARSLAAIGRAFAGETRTQMLDALMDGRPRTVTALAATSGVSVPAASEALAQLRDCGLVRSRRHGRQHLHELASPEVAAAVEALGRLVQLPNPSSLRAALHDEAFRYARSCYDHLAGELAVLLVDAGIRRGALRLEDERLLPGPNVEVLEELHVDVARARSESRPFIRCCNDWTERRPHLAGALGAALLTGLLEARLLARRPGGRALVVTPAGAAQLAAWREPASPVPQ